MFKVAVGNFFSPETLFQVYNGAKGKKRGAKRMSFLKHLFAKKEINEIDSISLKKEKESELTKEHVIHILEKVVEFNADERVKKVGDHKFEHYAFQIDDCFRVTAYKNLKKGIYETVEARLKEDKHELFLFCCEEDKNEIIWKSIGPWVEMFKHEMEKLEKAYRYQEKQVKKQETDEKTEASKHFTNKYRLKTL